MQTVIEILAVILFFALGWFYLGVAASLHPYIY